MQIVIKSAKIKTGFSGYSNPGLAAFVNGVITGVTDNASFPLTQPLLPNLSDSLGGFNAAMANAQNRDKVMIALRNTARAELTAQLTTVASSVTFEGQGDRDKLISSNFELYKSGEIPPPPLGTVTGFKIMDADTPIGLKLICDAVKGARSYSFEITPEPLTPNSVWKSVASTSREYTFGNLPSSTKFWCRIIAIGTKEQCSYSDPLSRITQ